MSSMSFDLADRGRFKSWRIHRPPPEAQPNELLLREHQLHLSHLNRNRDDVPTRNIRPRGSPGMVLDWWNELPISVKQIINGTIFKDFIKTLSTRQIDKVLIMALAERWWDTTNTFHLPLGEVTVTPHDFYMLTGLPFTRNLIPIDEDFHSTHRTRVIELLGATPPSGIIIGFDWFSQTYRDRHHPFPSSPENDIKLARAFILFLIGNTFLSDTGSHVHVYHLAYMENLSNLGRFDWGGAGLAVLYRTMCDLSRNKLVSLAGYSVLWESWAAEVLAMGRPRIRGNVGLSSVFPHMRRFHQGTKPKSSLKNYRTHLDNLAANQVIWNPWATSTEKESHNAIAARNLSLCRVLLDGPMGLFWYCGERVLAQARGDGVRVTPMHPPASMRNPEVLEGEDLRSALRGVPADNFVTLDVNYEIFACTYLMGRLLPAPADTIPPVPPFHPREPSPPGFTSQPETNFPQQTGSTPPHQPEMPFTQQVDPSFGQYHEATFQPETAFNQDPGISSHQGTAFTQYPGMTFQHGPAFTQFPGSFSQPPHTDFPFTYQAGTSSSYPPIPYPFSFAESSSGGRHSISDPLDWTVPTVTEHGLTGTPIPYPTSQEWAAMADPTEVTRAEHKKQLSLTASLKKMYTNLSSKFSCLALKTSDYDYMKQRLRHYERQDMGDAGPSRMSTSRTRTRTYDRSRSAREPSQRRRSEGGNNDEDMGGSTNLGPRDRD